MKLTEERVFRLRRKDQAKLDIQFSNVDLILSRLDFLTQLGSDMSEALNNLNAKIAENQGSLVQALSLLSSEHAALNQFRNLLAESQAQLTSALAQLEAAQTGEAVALASLAASQTELADLNTRVGEAASALDAANDGVDAFLASHDDGLALSG